MVGMVVDMDNKGMGMGMGMVVDKDNMAVGNRIHRNLQEKNLKALRKNFQRMDLQNLQ